MSDNMFRQYLSLLSRFHRLSGSQNGFDFRHHCYVWYHVVFRRELSCCEGNP